MFLALVIPNVFISTFGIIRIHTSPDLGNYLITIVNASTFFGRPIIGALASTKKYGAFPVYHVSIIACAILLFAWTAVDSLAGIITFAILWGFFSGGVWVLMDTTIPLLSPYTMDMVGTRLAMFLMPASIAEMISAPISAAIGNPERDEFLGLQLWGGLTMVVAAIVLVYPHVIVIRRRGDKRVHTKKPQMFESTASLPESSHTSWLPQKESASDSSIWSAECQLALAKCHIVDEGRPTADS